MEKADGEKPERKGAETENKASETTGAYEGGKVEKVRAGVELPRWR